MADAFRHVRQAVLLRHLQDHVCLVMYHAKLAQLTQVFAQVVRVG